MVIDVIRMQKTPTGVMLLLQMQPTKATERIRRLWLAQSDRTKSAYEKRAKVSTQVGWPQQTAIPLEISQEF